MNCDRVLAHIASITRACESAEGALGYADNTALLLLLERQMKVIEWHVKDIRKEMSTIPRTNLPAAEGLTNQ